MASGGDLPNNNNTQSFDIKLKEIEVPEDADSTQVATLKVEGKKGDNSAHMWYPEISFWQANAAGSVQFLDTSTSQSYFVSEYKFNETDFHVETLKWNGNAYASLENNDDPSLSVSDSSDNVQTIYKHNASIQKFAIKFTVDKDSTIVTNTPKTIFVRFTCRKREQATGAQITKWGKLTIHDNIITDIDFDWLA